LGGGGYATGFGETYLTYAVAKGLASASTYGCIPAADGKKYYTDGPDLFGNWFKYLVAKDPDCETRNMTREKFFKALHFSDTDYAAMLGANDPDLTDFKATGGTMITWHGLADEAIPPKGTIAYYEEVLKNDPDARDF
jgi:hypothetical protein